MLHKRKEYVEITWRFHFYHILLYRRRKKLKKKMSWSYYINGRVILIFVASIVKESDVYAYSRRS